MNREELNVHAMENYNHNCILAHGCPILLEIADKLVDFFVANNYAVRNISNLHSPYGFLCHGLNVTIVSGGLYQRRIHIPIAQEMTANTKLEPLLIKL